MLANNIKIVGHRGSAGTEVENSISAIQQGIEAGADYIEIDVWITKDGELIVFHDAYLDRLTDERGFTAQMTYEELRNYKLKNNETIPILADVLNIIKNSKSKLIIEFKHDQAIQPAYQLIKATLKYEQYVLGSFFHEEIMRIKQNDALLQTAIMFENVPVGLPAYLNRVNPDYIVTSIETYNELLLNTVQQQNRKLLFYTVNSEAEIELAIAAKPYGIITDYPERLTARLHQ